MTKKKNPHIGSTFESWLDEAESLRVAREMEGLS